MSFLSRLFGQSQSNLQQPNVLFGRYSDAYKNDAKYDAWDRAVEKFESKEYVNAWANFFDYLTDESQNNIRTERSVDEIRFEILQGSKKIIGIAGKERFKAEAKIARVKSINIGFLRRLIEDNYNLKYGRYCLDNDNDISIVFDTLTVDGSPYKLYYGLKEIALAADKQDDLLLEEFEMLSQVNSGHISGISESEKNIKVNYLRTSMEAVLKEIKDGRLDASQYPGGITYLLLDTVYRLDFLTRPEGYTTEAFERMHRSYFAADGLSSNQKNHYLIKEFKKIVQRPTELLAAELYRTTSTFGIISATSHEKFKEIVEGELHNMDWYVEQKHDRVGLAVPGYIVGHALFYYSLPAPDKDLLLLYYQIMEPVFFRDLGFQFNFRSEAGILNKTAIRNAISGLAQQHSKNYPRLAPNFKVLNFTGLPVFAKSYLQMMSGLDLTKVA